jgi:hypothetical protein
MLRKKNECRGFVLLDSDSHLWKYGNTRKNEKIANDCEG